MKIAGKDIEKVGEEVVVFPRANGNIVFKARPIPSFEEFDKICQQPKPKMKMLKGGVQQSDVTDPAYRAQLEEWAGARTNWMFIKSLEATEGLTWDTIDMSDITTWKNITAELKESGLTDMEQARLMDIIASACGLSQDKIDEATNSFLAEQRGLSELANSLQVVK